MGVKKRSREPMNWVTIVWIEVPTTFYLPHKQYLGWVFFLTISDYRILVFHSLIRGFSFANVGYFLVLVYCSVRWVFVKKILYLMANIYLCTYSYVGKIPICHSFWVVSAFLISVIDHEIPLIISCHQRGSTIGVVSKSD